MTDKMKIAAAVLALALVTVCDAAGSRSKWNRYQSNTPLEVGNYDVTYTLGGDKAAKYWVKFEGRRIAAASVETRPGNERNAGLKLQAFKKVCDVVAFLERPPVCTYLFSLGGKVVEVGDRKECFDFLLYLLSINKI